MKHHDLDNLGKERFTLIYGTGENPRESVMLVKLLEPVTRAGSRGLTSSTSNTKQESELELRQGRSPRPEFLQPDPVPSRNGTNARDPSVQMFKYSIL